MPSILENKNFIQTQRDKHIVIIEKISDKVRGILDRMTEQELIHFAYFCNSYSGGLKNNPHDISCTGAFLCPTLIKAAEYELNRRLPGIDFSIIFKLGENK